MKQPRDSHGRFASTGNTLQEKYDACQNILMGASSENARMRSKIDELQHHVAHLESAISLQDVLYNNMNDHYDRAANDNMMLTITAIILAFICMALGSSMVLA